MKKFNTLAFFIKVVCLGIGAMGLALTPLSAQTYYIDYQEGISPDFSPNAAVVDEILGGSIGSFNDQMSAARSIPFAFTFYGQTVNSYRASDNGYITFDVATQTTSNANNNSYTLPDATAPTNAIFGFWDDHELNAAAAGTVDLLHAYTVGDPGDRVHVIAWRSVSRVGLAPNYFSYFAIRLYESGPTSFDVVTQYMGRQGMPGALTATIGCQNGAGTDGTSFTGSPIIDYEQANRLSTAKVYAFKTGTRASDAISMPKGWYLPMIMGISQAEDIEHRVINNGSNSITSLSIGYRVNGGMTQSYTPTLAQPVLTNEVYAFTHGTPFTSALGENDIELWIQAVNGTNLVNPDTLYEDPFVYEGINAPVKKVLMEEFSTAPCQFCPDAVGVIEQIENSFGDKAIIAQHHAGFSTDAMTIPEHSIYASFFASGAPTAAFDRQYDTNDGFGLSRSVWGGRVATLSTQYFSPATVDVETYYNAGSRQVTADVQLDFNDGARKDTRLTVWVLEDSVIGNGQGYDQVNFYNTQAGHPFFGAGNPIVGYAHRHVVREVITGTWGDLLSQVPTKGSSITESFNFTLAANYDASKVSIVAFLHYYNEDPDDPSQYVDEFEILNADKQHLAERGVGIEENLVAEGFSAWVAPNPANAQARVHFEVNEQTNLKIELIDLMGKTVGNLANNSFFAGAHDVQFDVSELASGVYFVRFQSEQGVQTQRFMVAK